MRIVSAGKALHSSEFYRKRQKQKRIQRIFLSAGFVLFIILLIYVSRREQFLITEVIVPEKNIVDREKIKEITQQELQGYYLWFIPRSNALLYPRQTIRTRLLTEFPRLESVALDLNGAKMLLVNVKEHTTFALYCERASIPKDLSQCYFLDKDGLIFAPAPAFSGDVYFVYASRSPIESPLGIQFMSQEEFNALVKFIENLTSLGIHSSALEVGDDEYKLLLSSGGDILWRRDSDASLVRLNLEAFLNNDTIRAKGDFLDKVLRLDLRTSNKVFYKLK